jgi:hypothetical protein
LQSFNEDIEKLTSNDNLQWWQYRRSY